MSSSSLPSLDQLLKRKKSPELRGGSGAILIPEGTTATSATASTLLRLSPGSLQSVNIITAVQEVNESKLAAKSKATRKPNAKKEDAAIEKAAKAPRKTAKKKADNVILYIGEGLAKGAAGETAEKKPRKPRVKKGDNSKAEGEGVAESAVSGIAEAVVEKKTRKPRARKGDDDMGEGVKEKASRKPRVKKTDVQAGVEIMPKEKAARKSRAKKSDGDAGAQTKMAQGMVTKTTTARNTEKNDVSNADTVSRHFAPHSTIEDLATEEGFGLVEATKRRKNWTPPKPAQASVSVEDSPAADMNNKGFTDLLGSFGFSSNEASSIEKRISSGVSSGAAATRKRKLIEMVTTNASKIPGTKATKEKAVKKKARTLTELATSAYATTEDDNDTSLPNAPAPLLQYFPQAGPGGLTMDGFRIPPKPTSKSPVKGLPKPKKGTAEEPILLSPESALKEVGNQDFVFGTSSQLAREDCPSLLRDLHDAMQASNVLDAYDDPFASPPIKIVGRAKAVVSTKRNLWSVAARDDGGDLMDSEMVDLAHTPDARPQDKIVLSQKPSSWTTPVKDEWLDIDEMEDDRPPSTQVPAKQLGPIETSIKTQLSNSPVRRTSPSKGVTKPPPKRRAAKLSNAKTTTFKRTEASNMPDYESFTTPQLSKEIQNYKFKPIKSRKKMIDLLTECYESQNRPALGVLQGNIPVVAQKPSEKSKDTTSDSTQARPSVTSPRGARGRPKKAATKSTVSSPKPKTKANSKIANTVAYLEMDSDSPLSKIRIPKKSKGKQPLEDALTPSPPRRSPSQIRRASKALKLSPADDDLDDEAQQAKLFDHISTAITSVPPSQDPSHPSWHEKILLYDPIVLEDLASWLNTSALGKVGWDGEVDPKEVKRWCESKSICCLWKENHGGLARSRY